jgi:hypothetical protein
MGYIMAHGRTPSFNQMVMFASVGREALSSEVIDAFMMPDQTVIQYYYLRPTTV